MKLTVWRRAVAEYVVGHLPGEWGVLPWVLYVAQPDWFVRAVTFSVRYDQLYATALVQLLPMPFPQWNATDAVRLGGDGRVWPAPSTLDDAAEVMSEIAELVVTQALPFFEEHATPDGRLRLLERRVRELDELVGDGGWQDSNVDEELAVVHVLRGDVPAAARAAEWSSRAADLDPLPRARDTRERDTNSSRPPSATSARRGTSSWPGPPSSADTEAARLTPLLTRRRRTGFARRRPLATAASQRAARRAHFMVAVPAIGQGCGCMASVVKFLREA